MPQFSLSVFDRATRKDYLNLAYGAIAIRVPVFGLLVTDTVLGAAFTAELPGQLDPTDNASTTVHHVLAVTDGGWEGVRSAAGFPRCVNLDVLLPVVDATKLATAHDYDVRLFVSRLNPDGLTRVTVDRVVQFGSISVAAALTQTTP